MSATEGPYFDDLRVGDVFNSAPALTLTEGRAAAHQAITGSRLRLSLDANLSQRVCGTLLVDPAFVWDVAIGQSTLVTRRVIANLFYRGLAFTRFPSIGDTLSTQTEVVGLRQTASRPSGLAALRITTRDQEERTVLDFWRCAMLPLSSTDVETGYADDLSSVGRPADISTIAEVAETWNLDEHPASPALFPTKTWQLEAGDVVTCAPELARLTLNLAHVHHDAHTQSTGRLVYGGHTIGLAMAQLTRTVPNLLTVAGWHGCDHLGPVREGDTLRSSIDVDQVVALSASVAAVHFRVRVNVRRSDVADDPVLDWRPIALVRAAGISTDAPTAGGDS